MSRKNSLNRYKDEDHDVVIKMPKHNCRNHSHVTNLGKVIERQLSNVSPLEDQANYTKHDVTALLRNDTLKYYNEKEFKGVFDPSIPMRY